MVVEDEKSCNIFQRLKKKFFSEVNLLSQFCEARTSVNDRRWTGWRAEAVVVINVEAFVNKLGITCIFYTNSGTYFEQIAS